MVHIPNLDKECKLPVKNNYKDVVQLGINDGPHLIFSLLTIKYLGASVINIQVLLYIHRSC